MYLVFGMFVPTLNSCNFVSCSFVSVTCGFVFVVFLSLAVLFSFAVQVVLRIGSQSVAPDGLSGIRRGAPPSLKNAGALRDRQLHRAVTSCIAVDL